MKVAFIGAGAMGRALSVGAHKARPDRWSFVFYDPNEASAKQAAEAVGGTVCDTPNDAIVGADLVVLAVKPQVQAGVIGELDPSTACFISIAAGRSLADIADSFASNGHMDVPVVRVMPNVNAMVAEATSAICANKTATPEQLEAARSFFNEVGTTIEIPEKLFPAFTAMAGSSPAWFFRIVDSLAMAGVKHGLTKGQAIEAAASAMAGSAALLLKTLEQGGNAEQLIDRVCSPGGTTIAGLLAAEESGLSNSLVAAVDATVARDGELSH